jgi:hypothetical protein
MILLSDSMVTLRDYTPQGSEIVSSFQHATKLVDLGSSCPAAAMVSGAGALGDVLIGTLLEKASRNIDELQTATRVTHDVVVDEVIRVINDRYLELVQEWRVTAAQRLSTFDGLASINAERAGLGLPAVDRVGPEDIAVRGYPGVEVADPLATIDPPDLTIVIASHFDDDPSAVSVSWPSLERIPRDARASLSWWGSGSSAVARLVMGFDLPRIQARAEEERRVAAAGGALGPAEATLNYIIANREAFAMPMPIRSLPLQDAINLTEYLGQVASGYDRFTAGPIYVGGDLDVVVLTRNRRTWISRKQIHSSIRSSS